MFWTSFFSPVKLETLIHLLLRVVCNSHHDCHLSQGTQIYTRVQRYQSFCCCCILNCVKDSTLNMYLSVCYIPDSVGPWNIRWMRCLHLFTWKQAWRWLKWKYRRACSGHKTSSAFPEGKKCEHPLGRISLGSFDLFIGEDYLAHILPILQIFRGCHCSNSALHRRWDPFMVISPVLCPAVKWEAGSADGLPISLLY